MSEHISVYVDDAGLSESGKRKVAVEAALNLIKADSLGCQKQSSGNLEYNMDRLSKYADQIQEALKVK